MVNSIVIGCIFNENKKQKKIFWRTYANIFIFICFHGILLHLFFFVQCFVVNCDESQKKTEIYFPKLPCCTINGTDEPGCQQNLSIQTNVFTFIFVKTESQIEVFWRFFWLIDNFPSKTYIKKRTHIHAYTPEDKEKNENTHVWRQTFCQLESFVGELSLRIFFYKYIKWGIYGISIRFFLVNVQKKHIFHFYAQLIVMKHR